MSLLLIRKKRQLTFPRIEKKGCIRKSGFIYKNTKFVTEVGS